LAVIVAVAAVRVVAVATTVAVAATVAVARVVVVALVVGEVVGTVLDGCGVAAGGEAAVVAVAAGGAACPEVARGAGDADDSGATVDVGVGDGVGGPLLGVVWITDRISTNEPAPGCWLATSPAATVADEAGGSVVTVIGRPATAFATWAAVMPTRLGTFTCGSGAGPKPLRNRETGSTGWPWS
jgi:hypothetical protein